MHIGVVTPISIREFVGFLDKEYQQIANSIQGRKAPAVDALVLELLKECQVTVFTLTDEVKETTILKGEKLKVFIIPQRIYVGRWKLSKYYFYRADRLSECISAELNTLDLLHAHWTAEFSLAAIRYMDYLPVVITVRDWITNIIKSYNYICNPWFYFRLLWDRKIFKTKGAYFVANSPYIAQQINKRWHMKVPIIPNPIQDSFLYSKVTSFSEPSSFHVVSISNHIYKLKNIESLLVAYKIFHSKIEKVSNLFLVGSDFVEANDFVKKWKKKGLLENVVLMGDIEHAGLFELLDKMSLMVHPSLEESFGNTLIEAMSRKVPVIGGINSGAVPYVLDHGRAGCLCEVKSAEKIANSMYEIYQDEIYRKSLITNAYELVKNRYTAKAVANTTLNLYRTIYDDYGKKTKFKY